MAADEVGKALRELHDRARRLVRRAQEYVGDVGEDPLDAEALEPVRLALGKLDQLLTDGASSVQAELARVPAGSSGSPSEGRATTILGIAKTLSHVLDVDALYELIMDLVIEHSKAERGFLFLADAKEALAIRAARHVDQATIVEADREFSQSIIDRVLASGEPLHVPNALDDSSLRLKESVAALRILSVLCVPILLEARVYGVVYLESRSVKGLFTADDLAFVTAFCEQAALALESARAVQEARDAERVLIEENARLRAEVASRNSFEGVVGRSRRMQEVYSLVERVGPKPVSVLIRGENGTGKELIARVMHYQSPRAEKPFVSVNCAALPESLIESELFGIEKGTATGVDARGGKFEQAHGGTLFLDEVGDMSLMVQAKLLRVLQERAFERVGGRKTISVDVRIIAATNVDLERAIADKRFREDLYYRLNVVPVWLPALRDRTEDIPLLAQHFLIRLGEEFGSPGRRLTTDTLDALCRYEWPGNVRQLENVISRALVLSSGEEIGVDLLPPEVRASSEGGAAGLSIENTTLEDLELAAVMQALEKHDWIQTRAAGELGISERNLRYKMKKFGIQRRRGGRDGVPRG
jgi:transcriptional regulator with GAF, ATPase, and Fis domain